MKRFSLRYSLLTYRLDQLWFPLAFWALFAVMALLMRVKDLDIARAYLGCAIPLVGGILSAYGVLDDPALELRFATPVRPAQTLLERLGLIFLVQGMLYIQEVQPPDKITFFTWGWMFVKGTFRSLVLTGWILVYGLVGTQLSWTLRPFFGVPLGGQDFWSSMGNIVVRLLSSGR